MVVRFLPSRVATPPCEQCEHICCLKLLWLSFYYFYDNYDNKDNFFASFASPFVSIRVIGYAELKVRGKNSRSSVANVPKAEGRTKAKLILLC